MLPTSAAGGGAAAAVYAPVLQHTPSAAAAAADDSAFETSLASPTARSSAQTEDDGAAAADNDERASCDSTAIASDSEQLADAAVVARPGRTRAQSSGGSGAWSMQLCISALSAISGFLFGYDLCVMVVALPLIQADFELSTASAESVVSILMVGAVLGSLVGGVGSDCIGRKPAIIVTAAFFLLGSLFMTFAGSLAPMLVGRFLAGLAVGASGPCVSVYLSEIAHPARRGTLVTINEVMLCVGCLVSVIVSGLLQNSQGGWREMLAVTLLPPVVQLVGMPFLPESPRWLLAKNRPHEANAVLKRLFQRSDARKGDAPVKSQLPRESFDQSMRKALRLIASDVPTRRRVLLSMAIALGHNLTGANAMLYYSSYILTALSGGASNGVAPPSHLTKEIGVAIAKVAGVCTAIAIVDRVGRRPLLLVGSALMLVAYAVFSACFWLLADASDASANYETLGLWTLYAFIFAWNLSWAPLMWVICVEVLGDEVRSVGMGLTFAVFWLGSAVTNQTLLTLFHAIGTSGTFLLYAVLTSCSLAFVVLKVPETAGLTFEQIGQLLARRAEQHIELRV